MTNRFARLGAGLAWLAGHKMIWLMVGGAAGTLARYWVGRWAGAQAWGQSFPAGTFILGVAAVVILERLPPEYAGWYLLVGTGFCGGFTTFSTFEWETYQLVRSGAWWVALANVFGSVLAGFAGILLAVALTHWLFAGTDGGTP